MINAKTKPVQLGAGFSGLAAASSLAKAGYDVTLLEKNNSAGGRARKFEADGLKTVYPGLKSHPSHELFKSMMYEKYGVLDTLFPLTASCIGFPHETDNGQKPCGNCDCCNKPKNNEL